MFLEDVFKGFKSLKAILGRFRQYKGKKTIDALDRII
jgi:hypothetical protein